MKFINIIIEYYTSNYPYLFINDFDDYIVAVQYVIYQLLLLICIKINNNYLGWDIFKL
jgi:hypothetical protein